MQITSAIVLYAVVWFMTLFVVLPLRLETQGDRGKVTQGTPASAPADVNLRRKFFWVTVIAFPIWAVICGVILSGWVTIDDIDLYRRTQWIDGSGS